MASGGSVEDEMKERKMEFESKQQWAELKHLNLGVFEQGATPTTPA